MSSSDEALDLSSLGLRQFPEALFGSEIALRLRKLSLAGNKLEELEISGNKLQALPDSITELIVRNELNVVVNE